MFPLKSLFVHSAGGQPQADAAGFDQILHKLQQLIASESPGAAHSDQQLAALLSEDGIQIARRTVAKYRQMLGIPTAGQRNARRRGG